MLLSSVASMAVPSQASSKSSLDEWSVREKLVLACCVIRSGDQNWASVSRTIKPICETVRSRSPDWFSQKNCANQYSNLLEGTSTKKRKRTSSDSGANETPMEQIIRKLSFERIDELKKSIQMDRKKYRKLKNDIEKIRSGKVDEQLHRIWKDLHSEKKTSIEAIIPEDVLEASLSIGLSIDPSASGFPSSSHAQQQQQQSPALYHRSKSQRQPKATKKFETWMTQLKQQQARHHQSHAGSTHTSPHGQPSSSSNDGQIISSGAEPSTSPGARQHILQQQQQQIASQQPSFQQQQDMMQQQQQQTLLQHQQQLYLQQKQQKQYEQQQQQLNSQKQASGCRQTSNTDHLPSSNAAASESSSVLSTLLTVPTSEIKAAAALQKMIIEQTVAAEDAIGANIIKKEETAANEQHSLSSMASVSASAPTLSKLLGSASRDTSPNGSNAERKVSGSSDDVESLKMIPETRSPIKESLSVSLLKTSPSAESKVTETSTADVALKKDALEAANQPQIQSSQPQIQPLHIKVEDEDYMPENESVATPDSSQPSPHARGRKLKGKRGQKRKQPQHLLIKNLELLQDSEDTASVDEQISERDETESEVASVSDTKDTSDGEQEDSHLGDELDEQKILESATEVREQIAMRKHRARHPSSTSSTPVLSPGSPTLSTGSCSNDADNAQAQRNWRKSIMLVWKSIASHKYANVFMHPVTDEEAPGYHNIIKRPMDLSTIKKHIETGVLRTTTEFQRDIMLMFQNALMYNRADHDVYRMAEEMREEIMEQIQSFIATQLHLLVQSSDRDTMMLRGHRPDGEIAEPRKSKSYGRFAAKN